MWPIHYYYTRRNTHNINLEENPTWEIDSQEEALEEEVLRAMVERRNDVSDPK